MRWNTSPRWDVSPEWGTFHPAFTWEKYPTWVRYFSSQLACMPIFKQRCYFHCLLIFCFYFKFELLISIHTAKFYKMNCTFSHNNYKKHTEPKLNEQSCLRGTARQKLFTWRKIILPKWDLTCVDVRSQLGGMNPFSYKRFAFTRWNTPFCRDLTQVRRLTWVGWFFSYKQLLKRPICSTNSFILIHFIKLTRLFNIKLTDNFFKKRGSLNYYSFLCL